VPFVVVAAVVASAAPAAAGILVFSGALAWIAAKTIRLVEFLNLRLYELVIETAAGSHRGLISDNRYVVGNLAVRITDAHRTARRSKPYRTVFGGRVVFARTDRTCLVHGVVVVRVMHRVVTGLGRGPADGLLRGVVAAGGLGGLCAREPREVLHAMSRSLQST
jgi:hypothetical protein